MTLQTIFQTIMPHPPVAPAQVYLRHHQAVSLGILPMHISCLSGQVWITRTGSFDDIFLEAGESYDVVTPGLVVAQALPDARLAVTLQSSLQRLYQTV